MLTREDRDAIDGLFNRLADVEYRGGARDPEAEELIAAKIDRQPGAPYYMAQTVIVQQRALEMAEQRIAELEREAERGRGGLFGGLFGGDDSRDQRRQPVRNVPAQSRGQRGPWDRGYDNNAGGGFLAGAAQTAVGVAGGVLLGSAIASMFGAGAAQAAEAPAEDTGSDQDTGGDDGGFDGGGDFGGGGDFDMGGDF